ncbi:MAG: DUF998 domain-containing protein [Solirubrobacterales bacterium]
MLARVATLLTGTVVVGLIVEHAALPGYDPVRRTISEYANAGGVTAAIARATLAIWGVSLLVAAWLSVASARRTSTRALLLCAALLALAAAGLILAAVFSTQAVDGAVPRGVARTDSGRLHDLGAGAAQLALLAAAIATILTWREFRRLASLTLVLTVIATAGAATVAATDSSARGLRQRVLLAGALTWEFVLVTTLTRESGRGRPSRVAESSRRAE